MNVTTEEQTEEEESRGVSPKVTRVEVLFGFILIQWKKKTEPQGWFMPDALLQQDPLPFYNLHWPWEKHVHKRVLLYFQTPCSSLFIKTLIPRAHFLLCYNDIPTQKNLLFLYLCNLSFIYKKLQ